MKSARNPSFIGCYSVAPGQSICMPWGRGRLSLVPNTGRVIISTLVGRSMEKDWEGNYPEKGQQHIIDPQNRIIGRSQSVADRSVGRITPSSGNQPCPLARRRRRCRRQDLRAGNTEGRRKEVDAENASEGAGGASERL